MVLHTSACVRDTYFCWLRTCPICVPVLGKGILKRPFLQPLNAIGPVGGGHAAVGVQQDPETPYYQQPQEHH